MQLIETNKLSKSFKTRHEQIEAVCGVDLQVQQGEIFGFLGPNGAGKTTTLRMLTTLLPPGGGQATLVGYDLFKEPARIRERIGYVSQSGGTDAGATVQENVQLQAQLYHVKAVKQRTMELLAALELSEYADRPARILSGGQRRRLDLALGMVHRPQLLFLDEPTTGLDPQSRARFWNELRALQNQGTTIFLTTHYLEEADALSQHIAIIDYGKIVAEGTPEQLKQELSSDLILLGFDPSTSHLQQAQELLIQHIPQGDLQKHEDELRIYTKHAAELLPTLLQTLSAADNNPRTITLAHPTLDDVFLQVTGRSLRDADDTHKMRTQSTDKTLATKR